MSTLLSQQAAHAARTASATNHNLRTAFASDQTDIYVLTVHEMAELWQAQQRSAGKTAGESAADFKALTGVETVLEAASGYGAAALDAKVLTALAIDMHRSGNIFGNYYTTSQNGRVYIVFKGNQKLRKVITGTRYLETNTKMIQMGVGGKALQASAKGGFLVSIFFSVTLRTIQWLYRDEFRWTHWLAHLSTDIVKTAIAGAAGYFTAAGTAAFFAGGVAILPLGLGLIVGITAVVALNHIDQHFQLTQKLVQAIEKKEKEVANRLQTGFYCIIRSAGREVVRQLQRLAIDQINRNLRKLSPQWH
jgi:hypothetical protein